MKKKIIIIGGDKRFIYLKEMLQKHYEIILFSDDDTLDKLYKGMANADIILLPYPVTFDGITVNAPYRKESIPLNDVFSHLKTNHILLTGGKLPGAFKNTEQICKTYDYSADEELLWANAELTAEGLLQLIIEELPISLSETDVAILGAGRVGTETNKLLKNTGCKSTVFGRSTKDFKTIIKPLDCFEQYAENFDCVINTIPETVLNEAEIKVLRSNCLILEAASAPYGVDFAAADRHGIKSITASSLPGKTSPKTAAEIICKSVMKIC